MAAVAPSFFERLRRTLLGAPIPTSKAHNERLSPFIGLPVFSSDALSSVAYATEAILGVLVMISLQSVGYQLWLTGGICLLIAVVVISYQQTIKAYPTGGGSYIVASDNLGETPGLIAGAALLVDYILTVAVSVAAGVAALVSAEPGLNHLLVPLSVGIIIVIAWANLRGVRESGAAFAVPTYGFIVGMLVLIVVGLFEVRGWSSRQLVIAEPDKVGKDLHFWLIFVLLRAFAAGCTALTGIEAVSNGVQAFKAPEAKNAIKTLRAMAVLLLVMFIGTGYLAQHLPVLSVLDPTNKDYRTVVSQIAATVFGAKSIGFYFVQIFTTLILVLAANTAFADFPRLSSLLARDGYLPRPLARQGDRLVFHNGILVLAAAAIGLVWHFKGNLDLLLPLYAVGVFTAFTLSQIGMVVHWKKLRTAGWRRSAVINGIGAVATGIVAAVILITKAAEGAWIVVVLLAVLYVGFRAVKGRYAAMTKQLVLGDARPQFTRTHRAILLMPRVHRGILKALNYARSIDPQAEALHIIIDERKLPQVQREWERYAEGVPLVVLSSPFRSLIQPVLDYVDQLIEADPDQMLTVVVAEAVSTRWYQKILQENVAAQLKHSLERRKNVAVTSVRYFMD
jgi:amino acid transporter